VGLAVLALPAFVIALDFSVLNLAVPVISRELMPTATELLWIVDIYGFILAGFLVSMGTLGDRIGRRRLLMLGAAGFGIASVVAAYSVNAGMLIAARAVLAPSVTRTTGRWRPSSPGWVRSSPANLAPPGGAGQARRRVPSRRGCHVLRRQGPGHGPATGTPACAATGPGRSGDGV
jgi:MFS family permease